jgi:hypothetical protein
MDPLQGCQEVFSIASTAYAEQHEQLSLWKKPAKSLKPASGGRFSVSEAPK